MTRVSCYIDGYNLYHAIDRMGDNHLKWLDLRKLMLEFAPSANNIIKEIYYFSALAHWKPGPMRRHRAYIEALQSTDVRVVLGKFYRKDRECKRCNHTWIAHEEKRSDVNLAIHMLDHAQQDYWDRALLVTRDSDQCATVQTIASRFPEKKVILLSPPELGQSKDLAKRVPYRLRKSRLKNLKRVHIERSLFPATITLADGSVIARPTKYDPPPVAATTSPPAVGKTGA